MAPGPRQARIAPWHLPAATPPHGVSDRKGIMIEVIPLEITTAVAKFLAEGRTGNVTLNIKDGRVLGAHINEFISIKPAARPVAFNGEQHVRSESDRARN